MVRTLAAPRGTPRALKKVDALTWRAPWTHKARKTPLQDLMPIAPEAHFEKKRLFENHQNTSQICVFGEYALSLGSPNGLPRPLLGASESDSLSFGTPLSPPKAHFGAPRVPQDAPEGPQGLPRTSQIRKVDHQKTLEICVFGPPGS